MILMGKKKKTKVFTRDFFIKAGKRGGAIGGVVAAQNLTPEEKRERALNAVAARKWHPLLTDEEKARRAALPKRPRGRPRKVAVDEPAQKRPRGRPRKES